MRPKRWMDRCAVKWWRLIGHIPGCSCKRAVSRPSTRGRTEHLAMLDYQQDRRRDLGTIPATRALYETALPPAVNAWACSVPGSLAVLEAVPAVPKA